MIPALFCVNFIRNDVKLRRNQDERKTSDVRSIKCLIKVCKFIESLSRNGVDLEIQMGLSLLKKNPEDHEELKDFFERK